MAHVNRSPSATSLALELNETIFEDHVSLGVPERALTIRALITFRFNIPFALLTKDKLFNEVVQHLHELWLIMLAINNKLVIGSIYCGYSSKFKAKELGRIRGRTCE